MLKSLMVCERKQLRFTTRDSLIGAGVMLGATLMSTAWALESISHIRDVVRPACSKPSSMPPTPANSPATFIGSSDLYAPT
jgi:hypothetical protein